MSILCEIRNHIAFITLNRPAALNALSLDMVIELHGHLRKVAVDPHVRAIFVKGAGEKAFCAGGDIRALYDSHESGGQLHREFFAREYPLDYLLHDYPKPYIALIDGIVMGGGMGLAQGSTLRIVGDRTRMAMPEVAIGFFPDVGASYFLSRLPGSLGAYLALTGAQIRAADSLYVGLADFYLPRDVVEQLEAALDAFDWRIGIGDFVRSHATRTVGDPPLALVRTAIDEHFSAVGVAELLRSLERESRDEYRAWAQQSADLIKARSPTMLAVTLMQLQLGRSMNLADCLRMEIGMAWRCFEQGDLLEGIRALVIDKDNRPNWNPAHIKDVTEASVSHIFDDPWTPDTHPLKDLEQALPQTIAEQI